MCPNCLTTPVRPLDIEESEWEAMPESKKHNILDRKTAVSRHAITMKEIVLVLGLTGAIFFVIAGIKMLGIHSLLADSSDAYRSTAELFYHSMGFLSFGLACLSVVTGYIGWKKL